MLLGFLVNPIRKLYCIGIQFLIWVFLIWTIRMNTLNLYKHRGWHTFLYSWFKINAIWTNCLFFISSLTFPYGLSIGITSSSEAQRQDILKTYIGFLTQQCLSQSLAKEEVVEIDMRWKWLKEIQNQLGTVGCSNALCT